MAQAQPEAATVSDAIYAAQHALVQCMDAETRAAWRLVNQAACQHIYQVTQRLRLTAQASDEHNAAHLELVLPSGLVAKCPMLKQLDCSDSHSDLTALMDMHGLPCKLEYLSLRCTAIKDFTPVSACSGSLRHLDLHAAASGMTTEWLADLSSILHTFTALEHLCISRNTIGFGPGTAALADALRQLTTLRHLDLSTTLLSAAGALQLAPALQALTQLTHLSLAHDYIATSGAGEFALVLRTLTTLVSLDLSGNPGIPALLTPLGALTRLQHLMLGQSNAQLSDYGAEILRTSLAALTCLHTLHMDGLPCPPVGFRALGAALSAASTLHSLDLSNCGITTQSAATLASVLIANTSLQSLKLWNNSLGAEGVGVLAPALASLGNLLSLDLGANRLGPVAMARLAPALMRLTRLQLLCLRGNSLCYSGATSLGQALVRMRSLVELDLRGTSLAVEGGLALAPAIGQLPCLRQLRLAGASIMAEGTVALAAAGLTRACQVDVRDG